MPSVDGPGDYLNTRANGVAAGASGTPEVSGIGKPKAPPKVTLHLGNLPEKTDTIRPVYPRSPGRVRLSPTLHCPQSVLTILTV